MTAALTLLALLLAPASGPFPGYLEAMDLVQHGQVRAGADALAAFAVGRPEDALAADALWDAARLYLDRLGDPAAALSMLDRLVAQYPGGRQADRAQAELKWLEARRARTQPQMAADYLALKSDDLAALRTFLVKWPQSPDAPAVKLRLAKLEPAEQAASQVADLVSDPQWGWRAQRAIADRRYDEGDYSAAFDLSTEAGDQAGRSRALRMLVVAWAARLGTAVLALWVVFMAARSSRAGTLWPPPLVVRYFVPVAAVFLAAGYPMEADFRPAMWTLAIGGTLMLWLSGAAPARRRPLARALGHAAILFTFVFVVVVRFRLLEPLIRTLREGVGG